MRNFKIFFKNILIPVAVGVIVGFITSKFIDYGNLEKPILAPPGFLFPIIWTILYILMGISNGILEKNNLITEETNKSYYLQLLVNSLWSIFFFVFKWRLFSIFWIILLIILVIDMIKIFYEKNRISGLLQLPYLIWTIFAIYLNIGFFWLNK